MDPLKKDARVAGLLYLLVVLTGPFVLIYVPGKLFVAGDAAATARNILAHESLFRVFTVVEIVSELLFVLTVLALYRLLKGVGQQLASVMAILVLVDAPLAFLGVANHATTLSLLRGGDFIGGLGDAERNALAMLLLNLNAQATLVSELFWGLWLIPLGLLVYRSGFLPRLLGAWLGLNGLAYVAMSFTGLLWPQHAKAVFAVATPVLFGEAAFMLWLLVVGARPPAGLRTALLALCLGAAGVSAAAPPPQPSPQSTGTYEVQCTFRNPAYSGTCRVSEATPRSVSPQAACRAILTCLNSSQCVTKTYCNATAVRGGWRLVSSGRASEGPR